MAQRKQSKKGNLPYGNILLCKKNLSPKSAALFFEAKLTDRYWDTKGATATLP